MGDRKCQDFDLPQNLNRLTKFKNGLQISILVDISQFYEFQNIPRVSPQKIVNFLVAVVIE